ncbi:unnamed protein product [Owenia fusiformis]|uniref:Small ribosomal subunit protein mS31 n=1 Tax=Owenia fusiformis TaxID=6347 RepID=A0A8J1TCM4_OWEFU|nr:unnamed protein product [Owenia fusiformis]
MSKSCILINTRLIHTLSRLVNHQLRPQAAVVLQRCMSNNSDSGDKPRVKLTRPPERRPQASNNNGSSSSSDSDSSSSGSDSDSDKDAKVDGELVYAARKVATAMGGNIRKIESDLLNQLKSHVKETEEAKKGVTKETNLSDLFAGMRLEKGPKKTRRYQGQTQAQRGQDEAVAPSAPWSEGLGRNTKSRDFNLANRNQYAAGGKRSTGKSGLFEGSDLSIFDAASKSEALTHIETEPVQKSLWDTIEQEERENLAPPNNLFEEMITWTKQEKLWKFPITNEERAPDKDVPFHEHIFLEKHIEDFPKQGPIRVFMELVCIGLSKNPYLSVEKKKEYIHWFREYFQEHQQVIDDAIEAAKEDNEQVELQKVLQ